MELDEYDFELLRALPRDLRDVLDGPDPNDPVVQRLFPPYVLEDLLKVLERGQWHRDRFRVDLDEGEPEMVLGVLNDVRLTLGARIGIEHLDRDDIDLDHPAIGSIIVMDRFSMLQHELLRLLD